MICLFNLSSEVIKLGISSNYTSDLQGENVEFIDKEILTLARSILILQL